jgi:hypothetical protein
MMSSRAPGNPIPESGLAYCITEHNNSYGATKTNEEWREQIALNFNLVQIYLKKALLRIFSVEIFHSFRPSNTSKEIGLT